jgi:hypothetical protein
VSSFKFFRENLMGKKWAGCRGEGRGGEGEQRGCWSKARMSSFQQSKNVAFCFTVLAKGSMPTWVRGFYLTQVGMDLADFFFLTLG